MHLGMQEYQNDGVTICWEDQTNLFKLPEKKYFSCKQLLKIFL
jgi:hypothetical protein